MILVCMFSFYANFVFHEWLFILYVCLVIRYCQMNLFNGTDASHVTVLTASCSSLVVVKDSHITKY